MSFSTRDRPVDTPRYMTFQGLGGDTVMLIYPNLYQVEVFEQDGDKLTLKSVNDIEDAIRDYLKTIVQAYNEKLTDQLNGKSAFYSANSEAFNFLGAADTLGSPNRSYALINENYFVNLLGNDKIELIAELLHYHNLPWQERLHDNNVTDDIEQIRASFDINHKISEVVSEYLKVDNDK